MEEKLLQMALEVRERAYCPYSKFAVGAALLGADGQIYTGCNVESVSFGATNCAERTALFHAVAQGVRSFRAIAVVGGPSGQKPQQFCAPCGICRQVLSEFVTGDFQVILGKSTEEYEIFAFSELFPMAFDSFL